MIYRFILTPMALTLILSLPWWTSSAAPIKNIDASPVSFDLNDKQVEKAILAAGVKLGWKMEREKAGAIKAVLNIRTHTAVVGVKYNAKQYSIRYRSSENLDYKKQEKDIHRNYNNWVANLDEEIQSELAAAAGVRVPPKQTVRGPWGIPLGTRR
jgi:hypothetical protein